MNINIVKQLRYFMEKLFFSTILSGDGSVYKSKHVAQWNQYMKKGVIDGNFSSIHSSRV
jgi:hypothetical protein